MLWVHLDLLAISFHIQSSLSLVAILQEGNDQRGKRQNRTDDAEDDGYRLSKLSW
jgi:hypothetical protein